MASQSCTEGEKNWVKQNPLKQYLRTKLTVIMTDQND